jgi:3'-phosphoadenosine 5'-phosphosulfate sulfotransferase (PAPS reductase)/FAD synthetase
LLDFGAHERIGLSFSGGKDSLTVAYILRDAGLLDRVTVYHNDTGDLLPEVREIVEHVKGFAPHFVHLRQDVMQWIEANGLPSDLVPYTAHPLAGMVGQGGGIVSRYDCCYRNLMLPLWGRIKADGITLLIRGTRHGDFPRIPVLSGEIADGVEILNPIQDWSPDDVFAYLRRVGAPICRVYEAGHQAPECARCTAWQNVGMGAYLRQHHPGLFDDYRARMTVLLGEIGPIAATLAAEAKEIAA